MAEKKKAGATEAKTEAPKSGGFFGRFAEIDKHTRGADLVNFTLVVGANKARFLEAPIMVLKHWDLPQSSDMKGSVPCRRFVPPDRMGDYAAACEAGQEEEFLAEFGKCEYCEWAAAHEGFYSRKRHWVANVVQDGVVKMFDQYQPSIMGALAEFENDEDWVKMMPNGLISDLEVNIKKESTGPKAQNVKYSVSGIPGSTPLEQEQFDNYKAQAVDILKLKTPPAFNEEGNAKWAETLAKAGEPKDGERPKSFSN